VFVYAVGAEHAYRAPCREIVERARRRELTGEASVELVQEFLHQRARRTGDREEAVRRARLLPALCRLHDVERRDLARALELYAGSDALDARDARFAAVALNRGIGLVLSPGRALSTWATSRSPVLIVSG